MLALLMAARLAAAFLQDSAHVVLVATTDVHGHATAVDYLAHRPSAGGLARVATVVDSLRQRFPGQVVVVDAGDVLQGDPLATYFARRAAREPHPIVEAMNLAGYDAATAGNHDFDWGIPFLQRAVAAARFPYVSANIYALPGDTLLYSGYRVVQRAGVRIGITGFTTPGVMVWDRDRVRGRVRVAPIEAVAGPTLEAIRRDADLAVVLVHSGMDGPSSYDTTGVGAEHAAATLATADPLPDVVVVGHSHREMVDSVVNGVHFVQPRPDGASVAVVHVDLVRRRGRWEVVRIRADRVITGGVAPSPVLTLRLESASDSVARWVDTPVGLALAPMRGGAVRVEPTPLLDFVNEVQRRRSGADLSAASIADLEAGFDADTIRVGHLLSLYPYENTLRAVRVSGTQLKAYLEWSARYYQVDAVGRISVNDSVPGYDCDVVAGASYDIDLRRPVGQRITRLAVRGRAVGPDDRFTLALNSHRQAGSGGYDMLAGAPVVYDRGEDIRDLLVEEVRLRSPLDPAAYPPSDWRIVPEVPATAVRALFGVAPKPAPPPPRDTVVLRILATADLHGAITVGAAAVGATMDRLGADCECPSLRLDAGDAMQGELLPDETEGEAAVAVLNHLGYSAAALGDHDFDWSLDALRRRLGQSSYPWLAANIFDSATGRRPDWIVPYQFLQVAGVSVAVIGYITPDTKAILPADRLAGLRVAEGELAIHDVLGEVRARHPQLTVLLAHAGGACDSVTCGGEIVKLAEQLGRGGVDLVVAGHTHAVMTTQVAGIQILQAGSRGRAVGVADLVRTPAGGLAIRTRVEPVDGGRTVTGRDLGDALERYERRADSLGREPLARMKRPLLRRGNQFPLGQLLAEARRNLLRADIGLVRNEAIRADLPAGPVTYQGLSAVEPDRANLVALSLSGSQLLAVLERALLVAGGPAVHVAGARVRYDPQRRAGDRIRKVELRGGRTLRREGRYTLATDEVTAGAGGFPVLAQVTAVRGGLLDVEAVAAFLRRLPQPVEVSPAAGFLSTRD